MDFDHFIVLIINDTMIILIIKWTNNSKKHFNVFERLNGPLFIEVFMIFFRIYFLKACVATNLILIKKKSIGGVT